MERFGRVLATLDPDLLSTVFQWAGMVKGILIWLPWRLMLAHHQFQRLCAIQRRVPQQRKRLLSLLLCAQEDCARGEFRSHGAAFAGLSARPRQRRLRLHLICMELSSLLWNQRVQHWPSK